MSNSDLKSRDWLAFSTKQLISKVDPSIAVDLIYNSEGGMQIILDNVSEESIIKLQFLTNTDQNNNYLYLENLFVYINGSLSPLNVPGLSEIAVTLYQAADINEFIAGNKLKTPFSSKNIQNTSLPPNSNFNDLVDNLTSIIPFTQSTFQKTKTYKIILNPDQNQVNFRGAGGNSSSA
jgi:hypothetical protein